MVGHQTLNLAIGVRVPASQPIDFNKLRATRKSICPVCVPTVCQFLMAQRRIVAGSLARSGSA